MHHCGCILRFFLVLLCIVSILGRKRYKEGDVKLKGGKRRYMGTVLVRFNSRWGAICDEGWGKNDANTVCKQLGYMAAASAPTGSKFGVGRKRMFLSRLNCTGNEDHINDCPLTDYKRFWRRTCPGEHRTAGVVCYPVRRRTRRNRRLRNLKKAKVTQQPTTTLKTSPVHIAKISSTIKLKPTIMSTTSTSTLASTSLSSLSISSSAPSISPPLLSISSTEKTTHTTSQFMTTTSLKKTTTEAALGLGDSVETASGAGSSSEVESTFGNTELDFTERNRSSVSIELSRGAMGTEYKPIAQSVKSDSPDISGVYPLPFNMVADEHSEKDKDKEKIAEEEKQKDAANLTGLDNVESAQENEENKKPDEKEANKQIATETDKTDILLADAPKNWNVEVRLVSGRYKSEGHLQLRVNDGEWGTVCGDHWTLREARTVCNQLGTLGEGKQAVQTNFFGGVDKTKLFYRIKCIGREKNISECNFTKTDEQHSCSKKTAIAGVVCSDQLPDLVPDLKALELSVRLQDQPLYYLRCALEEHCLADSAYVLRNTSKLWRNKYRRLMRFSTIVHNLGNADFRPLLQRQLWQWHACHMHYHSMEVFAHYDIMDGNGTRLAEGSKASFCLEDSKCDDGVHPKYDCQGYGDQGLSVNCSDNYMYNIDCQWIDITDIKPGKYTFLIEVNPDMLVAESDFDNNVVACHMYYSGYLAQLSSCHFQSLLDYRRPLKRPVEGKDD